MDILRTEFIKKIKIKSNKILAIIFILVTIGCMFLKPTLETENFHMNKQFEKVVDARSPSIIANEKFKTKVDFLSQMSNSNAGDLSKSAKEQLNSIKSNSYKDITFWQVFNTTIDNPLFIVYFLVFIIMLFSTIYTDEVVSGVDNLILSSKNKFKVLNSKIVLGILIPIITYVTYLLAHFIHLAVAYGMPKNGSLQAFRILQPQTILNGSISIQNFIVLKIGFMILLFTTFSLICVLCSFVSKTSLKSITLIVSIFVAFKVIPYIKFLPQKIRYIFDSFNFADLFLPQFSGKPPYIYQNSMSIKIMGASVNTFNMVLVMLAITFVITFILIKVSQRTLTSR